MNILKSILGLAVIAIMTVAMTLPEDGYKVGDKVKDFNLKSVSGDMVSLSGYENAKGYIVIFDCNTCPFSQAYRERIKALHSKYADKGFPVIAIQPNDPKKSPGDSFDKMVSYAKENNYEHPYVYDADQSVAKQFGATNTPHVYVLDDNMVVQYIGAIDNNSRDASAADKKYVEDAVDAVMNGKKPSVTKTKAIGCTIKWAS